MDDLKSKRIIYEKKYVCPVCENDFTDYAVVGSKLKFASSDIDLRPYYEHVEPLYYDVILCQHCGYATPNMFFKHLPSRVVDNVLTKIKPYYKPRQYSDIRTINEAIQRYKLALVSSVAKEANPSEGGYICMKLAWLYRAAEDTVQENSFLLKTIDQFNKAFTSEDFPICGLDVETFSYMMAAFYKLTGNPEEGLKWLSKVVVSKSATPRLKDRALDLRSILQKDIADLQDKGI